MSHDVWIAKCVEQLARGSQLDDEEFLRAWSRCIHGGLLTAVVNSGCTWVVESMERMAAMDVNYRSQPAMYSALGITNVFEVQITRALLHPYDIERVLYCCYVKNIALIAELVRRMLDRLPQLIPLASEHLIHLCHQSVELPADRNPNEISLRGMAYLTLAEGGTRYARSLTNADRAQQECIETLWNWRLGSMNCAELYRYEDAVNVMMDAIRRIRRGLPVPH